MIKVEGVLTSKIRKIEKLFPESTVKRFGEAVNTVNIDFTIAPSFVLGLFLYRVRYELVWDSTALFNFGSQSPVPKEVLQSAEAIIEKFEQATGEFIIRRHGSDLLLF
jgi:hypothetical protein